VTATFGAGMASLGLSLLKDLQHPIWGYKWVAAWLLLVGLVNRPDQYNRRAIEDALEALPAFLGLPPGASIRIAMYVPYRRGADVYLRAVTDYVPGRSRVARRDLPPRVGIVGEAVNFGETLVDLLEDAKYHGSNG